MAVPDFWCKLVTVGDVGVGKTSLITRFSRNIFPEAYVPVVFESYVYEHGVDQKTVQLSMWDTAGSEQYDRLRPLSYSNTHVILLAYSVDSPDSLENVQDKWISELRHFLPRVPIVLVGCKKDLRSDESTSRDLSRAHQWPVSSDEGMAVAAKINAMHFFECSAKTGDGVVEVFHAAMQIAVESQENEKAQARRRRILDESCVIF
ncbi:ras-like protein family, member A, protein 2 [Flagelloscypha sp. PMI_526]|nr:ras-like protein family, member A, protein 2 [Flagelloscypha sp. PMI_526]